MISSNKPNSFSPFQVNFALVGFVIEVVVVLVGDVGVVVGVGVVVVEGVVVVLSVVVVLLVVVDGVTKLLKVF